MVDRGGRKSVIPTLQAWALRDRRKGDPHASVVGKQSKVHRTLSEVQRLLLLILVVIVVII